MKLKNIRINKQIISRIASGALGLTLIVGAIYASYRTGYRQGTNISAERDTKSSTIEELEERIVELDDSISGKANELKELEEKLDRTEYLKGYLTSDLVSTMKAKYELGAQTDSGETHEQYPLSDIYVLDSENDDYQTIGESANYAYRYVFFQADNVPQGFGIFDILLGEPYTYVTANCYRRTYGTYYFDKECTVDTKLPHVEPLVYYLDDEEIKDSYSYEELQAIFYRLNYEQLMQEGEPKVKSYK